jgi:predicted N-acyltransferase
VRVFEARTRDELAEFYRIYIGTMDHNQAEAQYYFPFDYFAGFFEQMPENAAFMLAEYRGEIVAGTLYLHDDVDVYSYLGGADYAFQNVRPTNAVVYETIRWAQRRGKKRLILGGGYRPHDGIFRFKSSFSPMTAKFYVYRYVHLPDTYTALCRTWADHYCREINPDGYFPAYRAMPDRQVQ